MTKQSIETDSILPVLLTPEPEAPTNPTHVAFIATSKVPADRGVGRPLGIETLGSFLLDKLGDEVNLEFADLQYSQNIKEVVDAFAQQPPDIVGISVRYNSYPQMEELLTLLGDRKRYTDQQPPFIVVGGVLPTFLAADIVKKFPFATVIRGEGELATLELTKAIRYKKPLSQVPSLVYVDQQTGSIMENEPQNLPLQETSSRTIIPDLIPQLVDTGGVTWISSSRGCPWNCTFCSVSAFREITGAHGKTRREIRPVSDVLAEIQSLYDLSVREFVFTDDEMLVGDADDLSRWHSLAKGISSIGNDIKFECSVRSDVIWGKKDNDGGEARRQALKALVAAGMSHVYIGFESGSPTQLKRYNKGEDVETHLKAIEILREEGVLVGGGFIMFDPLMNLDEIQENIDFIRQAELVSPNRKDYIGDVFDMLRVQVAAQFFAMLANSDLLGKRIPNTLFYEYEFQDPKVKQIADTCIELAGEIDDFFETLKFSLLAKTMADDRAGFESEDTQLLNKHVTNLRLLDLELLENLVAVAKTNSNLDEDVFTAAIATYKRQRKEIIHDLQAQLLVSDTTDQVTARALLTQISQLPDFQE